MGAQITVDSEIFYCLLSFVVLILSICAEKTRCRGFAIVLISLLSFIAGFRSYNVGTDTLSYISIFHYINTGRGGSSHVVVSTLSKDPGFGLICKVLLSIVNNYSFLLLVFSIIIYGFTITRFFELRNKISFSIAVFSFYSFYFFETMNALRQFCAVAIIFWATRYLSKRKYTTFIIYTLIAIIFHRSAALGFVYIGVELFSWRYLNKIQKRFLLAILLCCLIFGSVLFSFIIVYIGRYIGYFQNIQIDFGLRVIALQIIFIASLFLYHNRQRQDVVTRFEQGNQYFLRTTRIYYLLSCFLGALGYFFEYMGRIGYYFAFFQFVYFGLLVKEEHWKSRWILKIMVYFIILYVLFYYIFVSNGARHHPYHFIWS